jgi:3,4-dihydroxy-2-butanone 4-phosphate synthase
MTFLPKVPIDQAVAKKVKRMEALELLYKKKLFRMVSERCKRCGGMTLKIQKSANKNRYITLDARPVATGVGRTERRLTIYKKHDCREVATSPRVRK